MEHFDQVFYITYGHGVLVPRNVVDDDEAVFFGEHTKEGEAAVEQLRGAEFGPWSDDKAIDDAGDDTNDKIFND